jgi:AAA domain (dynein-related subfamily)
VTSAERRLDELVTAVENPADPSVSNWAEVEQLLAGLLDVPSGLVYASRVSKPGNLKVRADQSRRARSAKVFVGLLTDANDVDGCVAPLQELIGPGRLDGGLLVAPMRRDPPGDWALVSIVEPRFGTLVFRLLPHFPAVGAKHVEPGYRDGASPVAPPVPAPPPLVPSSSSLVLDPRIKRMLRLAIAGSKAVMLVGPPGTGKTTLVDEVMSEVTVNPAVYGVMAPPPGGLTVTTPEESWSARELVGGETVDDDGRLRFRAGHVLEAIRDGQWLLLDEANRADMDKIFGGLLTFLSHKAVVLGRAGTRPDAPAVRLEWRAEPDNEVVGYERLTTGDPTGGPIRFRAGTDWRLLGTYNALDAQRVFRFGQALGRRFQRVPVPPITPAQFTDALQPQLALLPDTVDADEVQRVLVGLYSAHLDGPLALGPAVLLGAPAYVRNGLLLLDTDVPDHTRLAPVVGELIAEAYLLGAGTALARLEPAELDELHRRIVTDHGLLESDQWAFLRELLPNLG